MGLGGLGAKLVQLKQQKKTKPCERCGLHYAPDEYKQCPHCSTLDDAGLRRLLEKVERQHQGNRKLGMVFFVAALVVIMVMLLSG